MFVCNQEVSFNSREFQGCFKKVRVLKGSCKDASKKSQGCFKLYMGVMGVSRKFQYVQWCFKEVLRVFKKLSWVFLGSFQGD